MGMSETYKQFAQDWFDAITSHDPEQLKKPWAKDFVIHANAGMGDLTDIEALSAIIQAYWKAIPDLRTEAQAVIVEGDLVAARVLTTGTNTGDFTHGRGSGGKTVSFPGYAFFRCTDEGIVEEWFVDDLLRFLTQLGAVREDILAAPFGAN